MKGKDFFRKTDLEKHLFCITWPNGDSETLEAEEIWTRLKEELILSHWRVFKNGNLDEHYQLREKTLIGIERALLVTDEFAAITIDTF